jgi:hypothetical protein
MKKKACRVLWYPTQAQTGLEWGTQPSLHVGLERESCHKLELTHPGKRAAEDIGYLAVARAIDACVGRVSQVGMIERILCLYFKLHR